MVLVFGAECWVADIAAPESTDCGEVWRRASLVTIADLAVGKINSAKAEQ
jgi:hypothetical protein